MIFSLDVRRAGRGDCMLLHFGSQDEPGLAIIDGGPSNVYGPHLRPRLVEIRRARKLDDQTPLPVDLLMVSHPDDDHIHGLLDLTRELINKQPPLVRVLSFWSNSFDDLINNDPAELTASVEAQFGMASLKGALPAAALEDVAEDDEVTLWSLKALASIDEGNRLRGDARRLGFEPNPEFDGSLIIAGRGAVTVAEGLNFIVAGPMELEIEALRKKHIAWLKTRKDKTAEESLAAYVDTSVTNLSSIVVLAEAGNKRMLLTGDARGDKILEGLELAGILEKNGSMHVDILKIPHHGSSNNLNPDFFERIRADHYVFSGDGEHGNPERETMEMLFAARDGKPFHVHLTYPIEEIDAARKADWEKEQVKAKTRRAKGSQKAVREDWNDAKQSLATFFDQIKLAKGQKIQIAGAKEPHVIDLLDPLGY
jgi:hypothetical protein